jgi:ParB family chromosome partitioning protein
VTTPVPKSSRRGKPDLEAAKREVIAKDGFRVEWSEMAVSKLPLSEIEHGNNPRMAATPEQNRELAESVRQHGVLQPIRVRRLAQNTYSIVAGHRRYEAAKAAGLTEIPVSLSPDIDDQTAYVQSLVENLQRENLDPIDEAKAYKAILEATGDTQTELGRRIGRSQPQISNSLALLNLQPEVQKQLSAGNLTVGHAKVLAYMPAEKQAALARDAVDRKLTVRDVEAISSQQKAADISERQRRERSAADAKAVLTVLEGPDAPAKDADVVFHAAESANAAREAGWEKARPISWKTDTTYPSYECECTAVLLQTQAQPPFKRICTDKSHERSAKAKAAASSRVLEREQENLLDRTRRATIAGLKARDATTVTEDGIRLGLYVTLMREEQFSAGNGLDRVRAAFVRRCGGTWPEYPAGGEGSLAVWEAVEGLNSEDLVEEYLTALVSVVVPNVYASSQYTNRNHFATRQWMVDRLDLEPSIVWGGKEPWDRTPPKTSDYVMAVVVEPETEDTVPKSMTEALAEAGLLDVPAPVNVGELAPPQPTEELVAALAQVTDLIDRPENRTMSLPLDGELVVVTGVVEGYSRAEMPGLISRLGGRFSEVVNSRTTLLVVGEKPGASKVAAAEKFGVKTMTEFELRQLRG